MSPEFVARAKEMIRLNRELLEYKVNPKPKCAEFVPYTKYEKPKIEIGDLICSCEDKRTWQVVNIAYTIKHGYITNIFYPYTNKTLTNEDLFHNYLLLGSNGRQYIIGKVKE